MILRRLNWTTMAGVLALTLAGGSYAATPNSGEGNGDKAASPQSEPGTREDRLLNEMRRMEERFDQLFSNERLWIGQGSAPDEFNAATKIKNDGDHYTVRISLPEADLGKIDVKAEPNNVLHIKARDTERNGKDVQPGTTGKQVEPLRSFSLSQYEQMVTLPGPVDAKNIKTERQGDTLVVTLPKEVPPSFPSQQ